MIALEAGRLAAKAWEMKKEYESKNEAGTDLVTRTDKEVEQLIFASLRRRYPDHKYLHLTGITPEEAKGRVMKPVGCPNCNNTGYRGRVGLYEVMAITDDLREMILSGSSSMELKKRAVDEGMITLRRSGLQKVRDGLTTIDEVVRETVL